MALLEDCPVDFAILREPLPTYDGGPDGRRATMAVLVATNDVTAFVQFAIHSTETIDHGGGVTSTRVIPLVYPDDAEMYLVGYRVEYFGTPGGTGVSVFTPQFSKARIHLEFAVLPFPVGGSAPFLTLTTDHGVMMETLPGRTLTMPSGRSTAGDWALRVGVVAYNLTTYLGTTPVSPTLSMMTGKVNLGVFTVPGIGSFADGTLRLDGIASQYAEGMFEKTMTKTFSMKFRERPWNEVMNEVGVWETPTLGATGLKKYAAVSFEPLKSA